MYNVVFVEDESDLCELYKEQFSSSTVKIHCFSDLETAESFIQKTPVSLIFIDYRMPQLMGTEFRKRLPREIPCVLVSGEYFPSKNIEGFIDVLEKPLKQELFDALLGKFGISGPQEIHNPYQTLFEHLHQEVHIWKLVKDSHGRIKTWTLVNANKIALEHWKMELEDVVGKTAEEIFPNSNPVSLFLPIVEKVFKDGKPVSWQQYFKDTNQMLRMISIPCGDFFLSVGDSSPEKN